MEISISMKGISVFQSYKRFLFLGYFIILLLRIVEVISIALNFGIQANILLSETVGLLLDFFAINAILLILFPIYYLLCKVSFKIANIIFLIFFIVFSIVHLLILQYFTYQLSPLNTFIYQYSLSEIIYTITTTGISYLKIGISLLIVILCVLFVYKIFSKKVVLQKSNKILFIIAIISIPLFFIQICTINKLTDFSKNKSIFFYKNSISYFLNNTIQITEYTKQDALDYQSIFSDHQYINTEYPLLHKIEYSDSLNSFFHPFDSCPNIVFLVVEGLNDDFIHKYRGVQLMPFLNSIIDSSLYWSNCLTVGERSFAVVPASLGGLPYGRRGFTLLEKYPRHLSLIPVLKNNGYYTTFFYGQGKWFHQKDRFFNYNHIDLIVDNEKYPEDYTKILVDDFFWGYNDKDLLTHSLNVIDTLPKNPRFDIYFTGTSHTPYIISDEKLYDNRFKEIASTLPDKDDKNFFITHEKYIKSIFFVDDALRDFFASYKEKEEYKNTIFIITGDHPMTELPRKNSLKRYHVPLLIYSEKLKSPHTFTHTVSHLDIYETVLSFFEKYNLKVPSISSSLGNDLFRVNEEKRVAFMDDNRDIIDYYREGYFLSGSDLYSVGSCFELQKIENKTLKKELQNELNSFKKTNYYVSQNDKILPDSIYFHELGLPIIFSENRTEPISTNDEYIEIISSFPVDTSISFDISFDYSLKNDQTSLVYTLSDQNNNTIYWRNTALSKNNKTFQAIIHIPKQNTSNSSLIFKSYIWNTDKKKLNMGNLKISIY